MFIVDLFTFFEYYVFLTRSFIEDIEYTTLKRTLDIFKIKVIRF